MYNSLILLFRNFVHQKEESTVSWSVQDWTKSFPETLHQIAAHNTNQKIPTNQWTVEYHYLSKVVFLNLLFYRKSQKISHIRNSSDSSFLSFIYDDLIASSSDMKRLPSTTLTPDDLLCDDRIAECTTQSIAFCENFSFSGMHHIFDQHKDSVNCIKFANKNNSICCAASSDGTLSICQLTPSPATILFILRGHKGAVTSFEWDSSNDLIVSCSTDSTLRLWSTKNGTCQRVFKDPANSAISTCALNPNNNNIIVTGNAVGTINILNLSTGIYSKNAISACEGPVNCLTFGRTGGEGSILFCGDVKGFISVYRFTSLETTDSRLVLVNKVMVVAGCAITSLSTLSQNDQVLLLANIAANTAILFKCLPTNCHRPTNANSIEFIKSFPVKHRDTNLPIKSSFCPSSAKNICLVTGSEDCTIYFYTFEDADNRKYRCVNKLQGHSAPVLAACFNDAESLLASADSKGNIIIWRRESL